MVGTSNESVPLRHGHWFSAKDNPNRFVFYEAYTDDDAVAHHKTTAHYKALVAWTMLLKNQTNVRYLEDHPTYELVN